MNKQDVIKILLQYKEITAEIASLTQFIAELEEVYFINKEQKKIIVPQEIIDELLSLQKKKAHAQLFKQAVTAEIVKLGTTGQTVIYDFYIYNKQWQQIARKINYSVRQCKNIRTSALLTLGKGFERNPKIKEYKI